MEKKWNRNPAGAKANLEKIKARKDILVNGLVN
jgi:hypothetical protein